MGYVVFYSSADLSINNGQGVYSRMVLNAILKKNMSEQFQLKIIIPHPKNSVDFLKNFPKKNLFFLPPKKNKDFIYHLHAQFLLFFKLLFTRDIDSIIYSVKPVQVALVAIKVFRNMTHIVLLEGLASKSIETFGLGKNGKKVGLFILSFLLRRANIVIAAYESAAKWARSIDVKKVRLIPCGIDSKLFYPCTKSALSEKFIIGYVGSFRDVHRLDLLLEATKSLDIHVRLYGNGVEFERIKILAENLGIADKVFFYGDTPQKKLRKAICQCNLMWGYTDIKHWGVPIKVFEYLACNRPVLVSKRAEFRFISKYGYGVEIETQDIASITSAISCFIAERSSIPINSSNYIQKRFNWDKFGECLNYVS